MLKVFSIDVYALHYPGATLFFVTHLGAKKFVILPVIFLEHFMVSTLVSETLVAKRVYKKFSYNIAQ